MHYKHMLFQPIEYVYMHMHVYVCVCLIETTMPCSWCWYVLVYQLNLGKYLTGESISVSTA